MQAEQQAEYQYAGFFRRGAAFLIDLGLLFLLRLPLNFFLSFLGALGFGRRPVFFFLTGADLALLFTQAVYFCSFTGAFGATPGKRMLRLQVVNAEGGRLGWFDAIYRETVGRILNTLSLVGYFLAPFDRKKRSLGDRFSETLVLVLPPLPWPQPAGGPAQGPAAAAAPARGPAPTAGPAAVPPTAAAPAPLDGTPPATGPAAAKGPAPAAGPSAPLPTAGHWAATAPPVEPAGLIPPPLSGGQPSFDWATPVIPPAAVLPGYGVCGQQAEGMPTAPLAGEQRAAGAGPQPKGPFSGLAGSPAAAQPPAKGPAAPLWPPQPPAPAGVLAENPPPQIPAVQLPPIPPQGEGPNPGQG